MMKKSGQTAKSVFSEGINLVTIVKGIAFSYLITIPVFVVFAFILTYTDFPEKMVAPMVVATTIISILVAGLSVSKNTDSNGWINGGAVGFIYMLVLYVVSSIVFGNFSIDKYVVTMGIIGILTGVIGGIFGVNLKGSRNKSKYKRANF